ncbi:MAG: DAK2 domain-containing protein [Clostridia bacterium]|nr:DAK2 domain-containing protein [Clostridia bacterium]
MITHKTIDGLLLRDMVVAGSALLEKNREAVDALNVFPVPDGDTGTNMSLTMQSATREVNAKEYLRADEAAAAVSKGALKGARGNSGVITSQLLRGFATALKGVERITPVQFANALKAGAEKAYKAVMKPKEGTILTVARVVAEDAVKFAEAHPDDYDGLINVMLTSGEAILRKTPEMLPPLKAAGVVDSGGRGLMLIYTGYAAVLRGEEIADPAALLAGDCAVTEEDIHDLSGEIHNIYCTEFTIVNFREDCTEGDVDSFRRRLNRIGDRVQVTGDMSSTKVHVHTNNPGNAIEYGLELGELVGITINNMLDMKRQQEGASAPEPAAPAAPEAPAEPEKDFGMVAVSLGDGFSDIFRELTVDHIVEGGQTMNPSVDDILSAINAVNAKTVFVFPNNGNAIFAANQAAELAEKEVFVIPTKNVAMGIAAAVAFQPDMTGADNAAAMTDAANMVRTGTVTYAVRDSEYNGVQIHKGDIIGMHNGQIAYSGNNVHDVVMEMMKAIVTDEDEMITVYYGADTSEADAEAITAEIGENYPDCEMSCLRGGQPLYYYLIAVE